MALFDAYLMVDWSGAARPRQGADSIWMHLAVRHHGRMLSPVHENPETRHQAQQRLRQILATLLTEERRVLVGFDFAFGYPAGFASALALKGKPWRAIWDLLARMVEDHVDNSNNRFAVAAELNRRLTGRAAPFWACPPHVENAHLSRRRPDASDWPQALHGERHVERTAPRLQSPWKLYTTGSVGSQTLTGIPRLRALRDDPDLKAHIRVWPFETGLQLPPPEARIVFTEIYPSMVRIEASSGAPRDADQVAAVAAHFAGLDEAGALAERFACGSRLDAETRSAIEREEGWVLGLTPRPMLASAPSGLDYLRDPEAITRESWSRVRAGTDLSRLEADLHPIAMRLVHTAGDPTVIDTLKGSADAVRIATAALAGGAPILVDAEMVAAGITRALLPSANDVICTLNDPRVPDLAMSIETTRAAAAVELWRPRLEGAVVAIGNAPTALFHLLEMLAKGAPAPAVILGFPVGFVGAAEAKAALMSQLRVPWITLAGARGGSALAAAAVNAFALLVPARAKQASPG